MWDTFCFLNTSDVKTLIEIMKYRPKLIKSFYNILQVIILAYFTLLMSEPSFAPVAIETVNKSHFNNFVNVFNLFFAFACLYHNAFRALVPSRTSCVK